MDRAFLFDMDGVIVDSERTWDTYDSNILAEMFGRDIAERLGETTGSNIDDLYERAIAMGATLERHKYYKIYDEHARRIYDKARITPGVDELAEQLVMMNFKLGIVTSSPRNWVDMVLLKIKFVSQIGTIISLPDRPELKRKPNPDSYLTAMEDLDAEPESTIILEDSNTGIKAAKASGAFVIGFRENLLLDYQQHGADIYANTMKKVLDIVKQRISNG